MIVASLLLVEKSIQKFASRKILTKYNEFQYSVGQIPHPAITLCPNMDIFNYDIAGFNYEELTTNHRIEDLSANQ